MFFNGEAGNNGFLYASQDQLKNSSGEIVKLYGTNVAQEACAPPKALADKIARRISSLGYNCVRFHIFLVRNHMFKDQGSSSTFNPEYVDRILYFMSKLKQYGVYIAICLRDWRQYFEADDVPKLEYQGSSVPFVPSKGRWVNYFHPKIYNIEFDIWGRLLGTINPYTGLTLANDPAVAYLEIMNENSLISGWLGGGLDYPVDEYSRKPSGNMIQPYHDELDTQYQTWLNSQYASNEEVLSAWGTLKDGESLESGTIERLKMDDIRGREVWATDGRISDMLNFLRYIEKTAFNTYKSRLVNNIGTQCPIVGTNLYHGIAHQGAQTGMDIMDGHVYHDHLVYGPAETKKSLDAVQRHNKSYIEYPVNDDVVDTPKTWTSTANALAQHIHEKPSILSESLASHGNDYEYEFWPAFASYMQFYGLDGLFAFKYTSTSAGYDYLDIPDHLETSNDPAFLANSIVMSVAFRKGYVSQADPADVQVVAMEDNAEEWMRSYYSVTGTDIGNYWWDRVGVPSWATLVAPIKRSFTATEDSINADLFYATEDPKVYTTTTGELTLYNGSPEESFFVANADKFQAMVGHINGVETDCLRITDTNRGSVMAVSLDDTTLSQSTKVLMSVIGGVRGKGRQWIEGGTWDRFVPGTTPQELRRVPGTITFGTTNYQTIRCFSIGQDFNTLQEVELTRDTNTVSFVPSNYDSPLFVFQI